MLLRVILIGILFTLIARAFWSVVDGLIAGVTGREPRRAAAQPLVRDPVCGTYVVPNASRSLTARGSVHYFCSDACRAKYVAR